MNGIPPIPVSRAGMYRVMGLVTEDFDCVSIEAEGLEKLAVVADGISIDFRGTFQYKTSIGM